jgi:hypothetical protein
MIDDYVLEISGLLVMSARQRARVIEDVREHLDDAVERLVSQGSDVRTAEQQAVAAFGPVSDLADQFNGHVAAAVLRRSPLIMAGCGLAVVAGLALAAVTKPSSAAVQPSAGLVQQVAFFAARLGLQFALVAGVRVLARVGSRWRTTPHATDHLLVQRAGVVFTVGLAAAACGSTIALLTAADRTSQVRPAPLVAGIVVMISGAFIAAVSMTRRRRLTTSSGEDGARGHSDDGLPFSVGERLIQRLSRHPRSWCAAVAILSGLAAMSLAETRLADALVWGASQAAAVIVGFVVLGPMLELRPRAAETVTR